MRVRTDIGVILVVAVYLPVDYGDLCSAEDYSTKLGFLEGLLNSVVFDAVLFLGDFNADLYSMAGRFSHKLDSVLKENHLIVSYWFT